MLWNQLDYSLQARVVDRIVDLLKDEDNGLMQDGIMAAVHELELWSNKNLDELLDHPPNDYIAPTVEPDPFCEKGWDDDSDN